MHDTCKKLGKELIVRPFASLEEDYVMMTKAYENAKQLGADYYCNAANNDLARGRSERAKKFILHIRQSFANEKAITEKLKAEDLTDFIVCGGGMEGHRLQYSKYSRLVQL